MLSKGPRRKPLSVTKEGAISYSVSSSCRVKHKVVSDSALAEPNPAERGVSQALGFGIFRVRVFVTCHFQHLGSCCFVSALSWAHSKA